MPGDRCIVCGNSRTKDPDASFHRFPSDLSKKQLWIAEFGLLEESVKPFSRVCSRHFRNGDPSNGPDKTLGARFASPKKRETSRSRRAIKRALSTQLQTLHSKQPSPGPSSSNAAIEASQSEYDSLMDTQITAAVGEPLRTDYEVHELFSEETAQLQDTTMYVSSREVGDNEGENSSGVNTLISVALTARIEMLEAENKRLQKSIESSKIKPCLRIEHIAHDDKLVKLYTGFISYMVFINFFNFLGPAVNELSYWGGRKEKAHKRHRMSKLNPLNQLFLTLIKLRLNLLVRDLAYRFDISKSLVSKYIITWICFLYHHLQEIEWMPSVEQVKGTIPQSFKDKYPSTYAIIDASEIFIETPTDLHVQSSTWSNYKHHNTLKFLIACTPNGAVSYVSPLYVGSISDVELTRTCGFIEKLEGRPGISIMADRGFTIKDQLARIGVKLNIPPFLDGRQQLPAEEVQQGRRIASLRIHVERAIGRIKTYNILKGTLPNTLARIANQVVSVCAWLTNFQPALVPCSQQNPEESEDEVDKYFESCTSNYIDQPSSSSSSDSENEDI